MTKQILFQTQHTLQTSASASPQRWEFGHEVGRGGALKYFGQKNICIGIILHFFYLRDACVNY